MTRHRYVETVARYFNGANAGDREMMISCFASDIAVYTIGYPPVFGAQAVAQIFVELHPSGARWTIDHCVVQEPEAVVEWSSLWTPPSPARDPQVATGHAHSPSTSAKPAHMNWNLVYPCHSSWWPGGGSLLRPRYPPIFATSRTASPSSTGAARPRFFA